MRAIAACLLLLLAAAGARAELVVVATEAYPGYAEANGGGYYLELLKRALPPPRYQLDIRFLPFSRGLALIGRKQADILVGVYETGAVDYMSSQRPIEIDVLDAAVIGQQFPHWQGVQSLAGKRVLAQYGYRLNRYLPVKVSYSEAPSLQGMLGMLQLGRADAVLDYTPGLRAARRALPDNPAIVIKPAVLRQPLYFGFARNAHGRQLKAELDAALETLHRSGEMRQLYLQHGGKDANLQ